MPVIMYDLCAAFARYWGIGSPYLVLKLCVTCEPRWPRIWSGSPRLLSMKSANALLCVPRGDGELAVGQQLPAILIADIAPPSDAGCYHAKVDIMLVCFARLFLET